MNKVLVIGSAEQSGGGVSSVIKLMKKMPIWKKFHCYWLGTQIQRNYAWKLLYAIRAYLIALFIIWRYDIIHFHTVPNISMIVQLPIFFLSVLGRKKIIIHIHMGNQLKHHHWDKLFRWHLRHSDLIILLAKKWQCLFQEEYADIKTPTTVLYNACEITSEISYSDKEKIIIMAAFFNENKAPDLLLKAWNEIRNDYKDWRIYMLGNGEIEKYKKMADDMGLADSVIFTGYMTGNEKEYFFNKASIYCMCSYEEGFPMVVLEAWAHEVCVISTPVGGLPDVIEEGKNMLTFDFGDWKGLARQLKVLMDNTEKMNIMGKYSRKFVANYFSLEKINNDIEKIYATC